MNEPESTWFSVPQAAAYIGVASATLYDWRYKKPGFGPTASRRGVRVLYAKADLDDWLGRQRETIEAPPVEDVAVTTQKPADSMTRARRHPVRLAG